MVAALNWLTPDKTRCFWPPFKSQEKCTEAVKNRIVPSTAGKPWEMLNIHFRGEHGSLEKAQMARDSIIQTDRIIKRPKFGNPQGMGRNLFNSPIVSPTSTMPADDNEEIPQMLKEIKSKVNENSTMLKQLLKKEIPVSDPVPSSTSTRSKTKCNLNLPLKTPEDVERTEKELQVAIMRQRYIKYLSGLGGFGPKDVIKNIMQKVLTDDLAIKFNWQGRGDKRAFSSLALADVIKEAASFKRNIPRENCEAEIKKYLSYTTERINRKRRDAGPGTDIPEMASYSAS
nr:uncharacterized protein LOC129455993 [Misgurnus anguillicaudatus]